MKKLLTLSMVLAALACTGQFKKSEVLNRSYRFEKPSSKNVFQLSNINGSISVEVHEKDQIDLIVNKMITGKTAERAAQGMQEISMAHLDRYDTLIAYIAGPCMRFGNYNEGRNSRYGYNWNDCTQKYDFKMDMTLRVPAGMNLVLSTVNEGDINVKDVRGNLHVNNVNGAITLNGVEGQVYAHTINGDVDINYNSNPNLDSRYYTLNGDINANFKQGLAAKISFKSFNGDMYTNVDMEQLPVEINKVQDQKGLKIKIDERRMMQARNGAVLLDFETFNGDAIVKEN